MKQHNEYSLLSYPVFIAMFGYFVDVYDIVIFSVVRIQSLQQMGVSAAEISTTSTLIINMQLAGLIIGGIVYGTLGDKIGRKKILLISILIYSTASLSNAFVGNVEQYALCRFIAGLGLAGELGAGMTLVSESVKKSHRSYATALVSGFGLLGGCMAFLLVDYTTWREAFIVGGVAGFCLLFARKKLLDSEVYARASQQIPVSQRGNLVTFFTHRSMMKRFACCLGISMPIQLFFGMFMFFSNEVTKALGVTGTVSVGKCVFWYFFAHCLGDVLSGPISQILSSRKKAVAIYMCALFILAGLALLGFFDTANKYYWLAAISGFAAGYWALCWLTTAETFGTEYRATATVSAPNFVRGFLILYFTGYQLLKPSIGVLPTVTTLMAICLVLAFISWCYLKETFGRDLDFYESGIKKPSI
ncbi:MFS transporter [Shewanella sp. OPT22]|nr:MFS transporter [Shewanella sp. OPT22]